MPELASHAGRVLLEPLSYHFMVSALEAGTIVAVLAGVVGYFMVLRHQSFAGHALAVVGFPGAAGAALLGVGALWGYYAFCLTAALIIALAPRAGAMSRSQGSAVTGTVQALALATGFVLASLYPGFVRHVNGLLFGSMLGITSTQVLLLLAAAVLALGALSLIGRPLLFASLDGQVAAANGVPVRGLSVAFLVLLALAVASTSQITGALLVFALLVAPPAAAQQLTGRPGLGIALSAGIGLAVMWGGLLTAYWLPVPVGAAVTTIAFACYLAARGVRSWMR